MKINYLINESANFWYFVANLSEWSDYIRPALNKYILEQTGELTDPEKNALAQLKPLYVEYGYGQNYWGKDLLSGIEKNISKDSRFNNISGLKELRQRFDSLWFGENAKLDFWKNSLSNQNQINVGIVNDCNILFGLADTNKEVNVLLLLSSPGSVAGGADIGDGWAQLEVSGIGTQNLNHVSSVLWHELIHLIWQKEKFDDLIKKTSKDLGISTIGGFSSAEVIKESITGSLLPYGLFRFKWLDDKNLTDTLNSKISSFEANNIKNIYYLSLLAAKNASTLSKEYIDANKEIDQDFIKRLIKLISI